MSELILTTHDVWKLFTLFWLPHGIQRVVGMWCSYMDQKNNYDTLHCSSVILIMLVHSKVILSKILYIYNLLSYKSIKWELWPMYSIGWPSRSFPSCENEPHSQSSALTFNNVKSLYERLDFNLAFMNVSRSILRAVISIFVESKSVKMFAQVIIYPSVLNHKHGHIWFIFHLFLYQLF